jgi:hypothetical protein
MNEIKWKGKTYTWWTNLKNTKIEKNHFREVHQTGILGDPIESKSFKTIEEARKNNQIGGYVSDKKEARKEIENFTNDRQKRDKYTNEMLHDNDEF